MQILFFLLIIIRSVFWPRLGDPYVCQSPTDVYVCHGLGQVMRCAYTICLYGQIYIFAYFPADPLAHPVVFSLILILR